VLLHRGVAYSPADEQVYATYSCLLTRDGLGGYPEMVQGYLATPGAHLYPSPARWAFLLPDALVAELIGCGPSAVAWVSTLSGIAMLVAVASLASRLFPTPVALVATAFVASSPLQLIVGRRALGDELLALVAVLAWWTMRSYASKGTRGTWAAACLLLVLGFGVKEIFFLTLPAVALPLLLVRWRRRPSPLRLGADLALLALPPVINGLIIAVLARSWSADIDLLWAISSTTGAEYPATYMSGPLHRLPIDLALVAPALTLLAIASLGLLVDRGTPIARLVAGSAALALLPYALVDAQDLRLVIAAETFLALLAAWGLAVALRSRPRALVTATLVVVSWNAWMVWTLSVEGEIYDPVTAELVRILGMG
jgi:hypothetical protein